MDLKIERATVGHETGWLIFDRTVDDPVTWLTDLEMERLFDLYQVLIGKERADGEVREHSCSQKRIRDFETAGEDSIPGDNPLVAYHDGTDMYLALVRDEHGQLTVVGSEPTFNAADMVQREAQERLDAPR